ncbi:BrnT family toxin [Candidatus Magnetomonas plexicatena]|nr:BrnT family toxin [Nitrospirales bacterium LBB_01]
MFEWSEEKRLKVLKERKLDFIDAQLLFDGRSLNTVPSPRDTEERWLSVGEINGRLIAVVWTKRDDAIRIITMRRARDEERRAYCMLHN